MSFVLDCDIWQGAVTTQGYARRGRDNRPHHRTLYEQAFGAAPGRVIHHLCNNRLCVNLDHMVSASRGDHMALFHRKANRDRIIANTFTGQVHDERGRFRSPG